MLTSFIVIHGSLLALGLLQPSLVLWLGAAAFGALVLLNLSGVLAEGKRRSRQFKSLKGVHSWLTLIFVTLALVHILGTVSPSLMTARGLIVAGTITILVVATILFCMPVIIEMRQRLLGHG